MRQSHSAPVPREPPTPLEALLDRAERTPEATAMVAAGSRWSCGRLAVESARLAAALHARGVRGGDRVALHMYNIPEAALTLLACWRIGAIAVPLNTRFKAPEIAAALARVRPALYVGQAELYEAADRVPADVLAPSARFVAGSDASAGGAQSWTALTSAPGNSAGAATPPRAIAVQRDAPAVLLATAGTTGPSKLVVISSRGLASLAANASANGRGSADIVPLHVPMMHASGVNFFSGCLLTGATIILLRRFEAGAVLDAVAEHRCTSLGALPTGWVELVRSQRARPRDTGSLRLCQVGGDICPTPVETAVAETFGLPLLSVWASTELDSATVVATRPCPYTRPLPEAQVRLMDPANSAVEGVLAGEMLIRSPGITSGYWMGPGRIEPLPDGWFRTGDLMRREPDGHLRYMGRVKDLIVRGGSNISPVEVEQALRRQPGVADAAVAGLPDPELGQRVGAALVLAPGAAASTVEDALAGVRRGLADYKVPEVVATVEGIPLSPSNKVDRPAVAARIGRDGVSRVRH